MILAATALSLGGCSVKASSGTGGSSGSGGGGGGSQNQTPAGTYPLTITAKLTSVTHTVQVTVIVQ